MILSRGLSKGFNRAVTVLSLLVEGMSMRSVSLVTFVARNTIAALLQNVGAHAKNHHDRFVQNVAVESCELDEIWGFGSAKQKNATKAGTAIYGLGSLVRIRS